MKKLFTLLGAIICLTLFQNSANAMGVFYTNATYPITATGTTVKDLTKLKKGTASATNVLYFVEVGDAGVDTAAKNGNIEKISHIDVNELTVFFFFRKLTVTVYGE